MEKNLISEVATDIERFLKPEYLNVARIRRKESTFTTMTTNVNDKKSGWSLRIAERETAIGSSNGRVNKGYRGEQARRENSLQDIDMFAPIAIRNLKGESNPRLQQ